MAFAEITVIKLYLSLCDRPLLILFRNAIAQFPTYSKVRSPVSTSPLKRSPVLTSDFKRSPILNCAGIIQLMQVIPN